MVNPEPEIKKILVPLDFSGNSIMLIKKASKVAKELGAELEIVHVVESLAPYMGFAVPHIPLDSMGKDLYGYAEKKMESFLAENLSDDIPHQAKIITGNDAAAEIIRHAEENNCDLIIIATQGFKGLPKFLFGSVAERVLKQAHCPVMTVKPR
ncbi:universal stress protein [Desulfurivibrio alkaliphilus]|uniref:Universal stress protein n=1 Tax=Desulfurivibrio alkaliphilus (strain DSM 19089 / UNIQEM U267 / AHT2) TaxID=589865 RepID=D6YZX6_DESAT|nr:universal stress protein [Desulfurivibrio alkaliphilus]ADH85133.1 UspA domain protein [Desulfurivibrio alkaliphilus AHT 2]